MRFYVRWLNRDPEDPTDDEKWRNRMYVDMTLDGCMTLHIDKRFLYPGESECFAKCIDAANKEREERVRKAKQQWFEEHKNLREHYGSSVTHSILEARALLSKAPMRLAPASDGGEPDLQVQIDGEWLNLCRTDLKDDVATHIRGHTSGGVEAARTYYLKHIRYGARVRDPKHGPGAKLFAVVDSLSDG